MIGAAEELLWPAERVPSKVGIIYPRSSFFWDEQDVELPRGIMDCTNHNMLAGPDYLREVFGLYSTLALDLNIAVDFMDEDQLLDAAALSAFKVLFVTEPDLPLAGGAALLKWVSAGGTLVTVAGAGQFDEYDEPNPNFQTGLLGKGLVEKPKARSIASPANTVNGTLSEPLAGCKDSGCKFEAWGVVTAPAAPAKPAGVLATFDDGAPALVANTVGKGRSLHFYFLPGQSFRYGYAGEGGNASMHTLMAVLENITAGAADAPVTASSRLVETPLLAGPEGSVVTLLNWARHEFNSSTGLLTLNISLGFAPSKASSVEHGAIVAKPLAGEKGAVTVTVPLQSADFLLFHK